MKDLPRVYQSPLGKKVDNNKELFYSRLKNSSKEKSIPREIDRIFHDRNFVYKSEVEIETKDGIEVKTIVGRSGNYLLALDGSKIRITDILDIHKTN